MASTSCHQFSLSEINEATNNFDPTKILGSGGEGDVFLGHIYLDHQKNEKTPVAVKRLKENSTEFDSEIEIVSKIRHPHLVSLLGHCNESGHKILVYEFMQRESLSKYIYKKRSILLSWKQRLNICLGAARGLQRLHSETPELPKGIIHRDVKPDNILLDGNWVAKVSDFGLLKLSHAEQTDSVIKTVKKGTEAYFAPECVYNFQITRKTDVYAFGVVLSEVLCGQKPWERGDESFYLSEHEDLGAWAQNNVDVEIEDEISKDSLEMFTDVIGSTLQQVSSNRPSMDNVVMCLENALRLQEEEDEANKLGEFLGFRPKAPSTLLEETRAEYEHVDTYVCDVGGATTKVGYSGTDCPKVVFPTAVVGFHAYDDDETKFKNPFVGGFISDWDEYFRVLDSTLNRGYGAATYRCEHPVLLMEPQPHLKYNPKGDRGKAQYMKIREHLVTYMFEKFGAPAFYVAVQPVLSLYANNLTTGIVVESGEGLSYSVPIYEGHVLTHAVTILKLAGQGLTNFIKENLKFKSSSKFLTDLEVMREMKETLAYIAIDFDQELSRSFSSVKQSYNLPDGQSIDLGFERFQSPEALFKPYMIGMDEKLGIHNNTYNSIKMCDPELWDKLYGNILLSGGSTMLPGLANRLKKEIKLLARGERHSPIKIWAPENRRFGAWVGGSAMASLSTFKNICISRAEYEEYGAKIVHRKCF